MKQTFINVLLFVIYFAGYIFVAALNTGGGHGNFYLFAPVVPLVLVFIAVLFLGKTKNLPLIVIFICLMVVHYGWVIYYLAGYDFNEDKGWKFGLSAAVLPIIWYSVGQILIWVGFLRKFDEKE